MRIALKKNGIKMSCCKNLMLYREEDERFYGLDKPPNGIKIRANQLNDKLNNVLVE